MFTLYKAALAFRRVGDANYLALADQVWNKLAVRIAREGLQIGGESFALDQLQTELQRTSPTDTRSPLEWTLFRGDATRTAEGSGSAPFLEANWRHSNIQERIDPATRQTVETARAQGGKADAFIAGVLPDCNRGKLIFRNYMGITAVDATTGELLWYSENLGGLDMLFRDSSMKPAVISWYETTRNSSNHSIIFENTTIGTLSTDNVRVYAVDDLGVRRTTGAQQWNGGVAPTPSQAMMSHNSLVAIELDSGKIAWERGDVDKDSELATSFFSAATAIAGQLICID